MRGFPGRVCCVSVLCDHRKSLQELQSCSWGWETCASDQPQVTLHWPMLRKMQFYWCSTSPVPCHRVCHPCKPRWSTARTLHVGRKCPFLHFTRQSPKDGNKKEQRGSCSIDYLLWVSTSSTMILNYIAVGSIHTSPRMPKFGPSHMGLFMERDKCRRYRWRIADIGARIEHRLRAELFPRILDPAKALAASPQTKTVSETAHSI